VLAYYKLAPHVVYVDGAHEYESVRADVAAYWRLLRPGGFMIGDDYMASWPGVMRAADEHAAATGVPLTLDGCVWSLRKPL
jgi:predicted O-methyltransferase YrrM